MTKVNLIALSKPSAYTGCTTANDLVAWVARVSNPQNQLKMKNNGYLIRHLVTHKHWSPLELVHIAIEVTTTRDIARQMLRHRSFSFQEYSQRYADPTTDLGFSLREARLQDVKNRQNSIEIDDKELQEEWNMQQTKHIDASKKRYQWAIDHGIAKEQARVVLPEGNTNSVVIMDGSLRSWIHYWLIRADPATQKEHREVANMCWDIISQHFPDVVEALNMVDESDVFESVAYKLALVIRDLLTGGDSTEAAAVLVEQGYGGLLD